eukprot:scaffold242324_cov21-Tisochrysis_lutea.AAC.1
MEKGAYACSHTERCALVCAPPILPGGAYSAASTMARCACCGDSAVGSWAITAARYLHRDLRRRWAASCFLLLSPRAPLPSGVLLSSLAQFNSASCGGGNLAHVLNVSRAM